MAESVDKKTSTPLKSKNDRAFEDHWDEETVVAGLLNGTLIESTLRINPKNYKEAYIAAPDEGEDVLIEGLRNRNKALNGDIVVCVLLPVASAKSSIQECQTPKKTPANDSGPLKENISTILEQDSAQQPVVKTPKPDKPKARKKKPIATPSAQENTDEVDKVSEQLDQPEVDVKKKRTRRSKKKKNTTVESLAAEIETICIIKDSKDIIVLEEVLVERNIIINTPEKVAQDELRPRRTAKVVFIKEYKHSRRAIGTLRPWPYGQSTPEAKWVLFAPKDHRLPRFKIPFQPALATYMAQPSMLYLAQILSWEEVNHPLGCLCYCVGNSGDVETETVALLLEHEVDYTEFAQEVLDDLPKLPWSIPKEELEKRRDFRDHCIFTIDPADARDLDDAVCGRILSTADDGTKLYEISVHIADVSFFVRENTLLDGIASQRATSTYLVDRVIPMLPSVLCEHICSLNPGEDRLAFSVEWTVNDRGEILKEWFGRSVINSRVKLSYDHAQAVIEGREDVNWPEIKGAHSVADIRESILVLQELANHLRKKRVAQGALRIDLPRLAFSMDWKTRTPIGFRVYELKESNRLIEEFMLLANMRVAEKIYSAFPQVAVLRCHPPPPTHKLEQLADILQTVGIHLDVTSSATLQESLLRYGQGGDDAIAVGRNLVISNLLAKPMKCASYICSGSVKKEENFRHYALSVPFYTHFTSPIRRYPDILVHRLLSAALEAESLEHWEKPVVKRMLDNCNARKLAAKALQESHSELHLANLIRKSGSMEVKGIVLAVLDHSVDIVLLYMGITRRLYLEKLPLDQLVHEKYNGIGKLTLVWHPEKVGSPPTRQTISVFSLLEIQLVPHAENDKLDFNLVLQRPTPI